VSKTLKDFLPGLYAETGLFEEGRDAEMEWVSLVIIRGDMLMRPIVRRG
jgi:hypothetical protein